MELPKTPQRPNLTPESFSFLFPGAIDGIGKSSLLASVPNLLIIDPDKSCKALPGYIIDVPNWTECKNTLKALQKEDLSLYSGLGIDNLNIIHDHFFSDFCKKEGHPGDKNDMGKTWNKATREFIGWLRDMKQAMGGLFIATCHTNIIELKMNRVTYNKYVPAIPGGGPRGTYRQVMEMFDIVGFMTRETEEEEAPTAPKDSRADLTILKQESNITIHFLPSVYYEAKDNSRQLPHSLTLPKDWREDWNLIIKAWGKNNV